MLFYFGFITAIYMYIRKYINDSVVRIALIGYESVYILLMFGDKNFECKQNQRITISALAVAVGRVIRIKKEKLCQRGIGYGL